MGIVLCYCVGGFMLGVMYWGGVSVRLNCVGGRVLKEVCMGWCVGSVVLGMLCWEY